MDLDAWPNCPTPDCQWKVCVWAGTGLCGPCSTRVIGAEEVARRYRDTHDADGRLKSLRGDSR